MTTAAPLAPDMEDTPLTRARMYMQLFMILFCGLFEKPRPTVIAAHEYRMACAWLRGLEAIVRRILLTFAAALAPDLPPARPPKPHPARTASGPPTLDQLAVRHALNSDVPLGRASFCVPLRAADAPAPVRAPSRRSPPPKFPRTGLAFRPLGRRWNAIVHVMENPEAAARRLAFRIRAIHAAQGLIQVVYSVRVHPDHARYLVRDIDLTSHDANAALRALFYADTS